MNIWFNKYVSYLWFELDKCGDVVKTGLSEKIMSTKKLTSMNSISYNSTLYTLAEIAFERVSKSQTLCHASQNEYKNAQYMSNDKGG